MKVILLQTVPKLGKEGTVVNVADGYARNFLFPRGYAIYGEKKQLEALERRRARASAKLADEKTSAEQLREKIHGQTVKIEGQVGAAQGKLFGAITAQDVAEAIKSQLGLEIERKRIALVQPIKKLGSHPIELDLHPEVDATVTVNVFDPNAPEPAPEAPAETAEPEEELVEA